MEVQTLKRHFQTHSASDTGMTTHSFNFPHSVQDIIMFKLCLFLGGTMPKSLYHHSDLYSVNLSIWKFYLKVHHQSRFCHTHDSFQQLMDPKMQS